MKQYDFNECGVCMNPDIFTFKCDQGSFQVRTAFIDGLWVGGYNIQLTDQGCCYPCSKSEYSKKFSSKNEATNDVYSCIRNWLKGKGKVDKLIREAERNINRQLELFV